MFAIYEPLTYQCYMERIVSPGHPLVWVMRFEGSQTKLTKGKKLVIRSV